MWAAGKENEADAKVIEKEVVFSKPGMCELGRPKHWQRETRKRKRGCKQEKRRGIYSVKL